MAASRVKVNIDRLKLIEALETKLANIESDNKEELPSLHKLTIDYLEKCIEAVKKDEDLPNRNSFVDPETGYEVLSAYYYRNRHAYGRRKSNSRDSLKVRLEKQITILKLSDDKTVNVGVTDELYELL